jgi:hypothetical protein
LEGLDYLRMANNDAELDGNVLPFISFGINQKADVCVAHDDRITSKPGWLNSFTGTGDNLVVTDQGRSFTFRASNKTF